MTRYIAAAVALKAFSSGPLAKRVYRALGNHLGAKQRIAAPLQSFYLHRIRWKASLCRKYGILRDGDHVLELGTGWVHWEAITLSLFWDVRAVLYDVWDNRQLGALHSFARKLQAEFDRGFTVEGVDMRRARGLILEIVNVPSFEALYDLLGYRYVVDPQGTLRSLEAPPFRLVVSAGVFEHIRRESLPESIGRWQNLLAPGGFALHSINIADHLMQYAPKASPKQYLAYPERIWKTFFENDVQYINRVQRSEWLDLFAKAGLVVREENGSYAELRGLRVNERYSHFDPQDLECTHLEVTLQKPDDEGRSLRH